jgi:23S rRNA (guanosine2251-2'-O)-methyltransferase
MSEQEFIFGMHPVMEAFHAGRTIDRIYMQDGLKNDAAIEIKALCKVHNVYIHYVPQVKIDYLSKGKSHQGVIAVLTEIIFKTLEEVLPEILEREEIPLLIMLDKVTDVRNVGAVARTMDAMGAQALIVPLQGSARMNAEAMKASAGALMHIDVCREKNLRDTIMFLKESGVRIVACHEAGANEIFREDLSEPVCLLFGSESEGISTALLKLTDSEISIPMKGKVGSLNVSVAAGMVLYEAMSQRRSIS